MSDTKRRYKVEAEHPRRLTNCIDVVEASTKGEAEAAFRAKQDEYHPNNYGPVTDEWPIVSVTRLP